MTRFIWRLVAPAVRRASSAIMVRMAEHRDVDGIRIADVTQDGEAGSLFPRIEDALDLIRHANQRRYRRLCMDVRRIIVMHQVDAAGAYWHASRSIVLDVDFVTTRTPLDLAMVIVHEATHARLRRRGISPEHGRERIERACVREEVRFASRIPSAGQRLEHALKKLDLRWWERPSRDPEFYDRRLARAGTPRWLRRVLTWLYG